MAQRPLVLIVEDELTQLKMLETIITRAGYDTESLGDGAAAVDRLSSSHKALPDLVVLDLGLPKMSGLEVLKHIRPQNPDLPIIMLTAQSSINTVVEAMRAGANDFIAKPASAERIRTALDAALGTASLVGEIAQFKQAVPKGGLDTLIGDSTAMTAAKKLAAKAASSTIPLLLEGESGVGKEVFANAVHHTSMRRNKPFVAVNCGAIPENLVESILFGHEKGAFTGATEKRLGKFQEANGGTLFLDEVGELPLDVQVKMLRALQEKEIDPVGSRASIPVDIRIISATNRNLATSVEAGHFREDLYYRLNVFPISLPALRERQEDIPALVNHFLNQLSEMEDLPKRKIHPDLLTRLKSYPWPGNVRQLQNAVFRAVVLSDKELLNSQDFPVLSTAIASTTSSDPALATQTKSSELLNIPAQKEDGHIMTMAEIEKRAIQLALNHYEGRMTEVAKRLGIGRSTLYRKIEDYQLVVKSS